MRRSILKAVLKHYKEISLGFNSTSCNAFEKDSSDLSIRHRKERLVQNETYNETRSDKISPTFCFKLG